MRERPLFKTGFTCHAGRLVKISLAEGGFSVGLGSNPPFFIKQSDPFMALERKEGERVLALNKNHLFVMYGDQTIGHVVVMAILRRKEIKREVLFAICGACQGPHMTAEALYEQFGKDADYVEPKLLQKMMAKQVAKEEDEEDE